MVLRNVPSTATFEEQRVEINELAADVNAISTDLVVDASPQLGGDLDLNGNDITGTGNISYTGDLDIAGKIVAGSNGNLSIGPTGGNNPNIFFNNNGTATFENTVIADGVSTSNNRLVVRTLNDEKFTVIGDGTVEIGGTPGTSPNIKLYASGSAEFGGGVDLAATNVNGSSINTFGGYTVQGSNGLRIVLDGYNQTTNTVRILTDGSATFASNIRSDGQIRSDRFKCGNNADQDKILLNNDGSATFDGNITVGAPDVTNASTGGIQAFASGQLRIQRDGAGTATDKRFQMYYGTTETASITAAGAATFASDVNVATAVIAGSSSYTSAPIQGVTNKLDRSSVLAINHNIGGPVFEGRRGDTNVTTTVIKADGSGEFGAASNSTGNNGVLVGGNNGSLNVYTDRYATDCFQILNTTGSGTNIALKAYGNGNLELAGTISDSKGELRKIIKVDKTAQHTLVASDAGKAIYITTGGVIIPDGVLSAGDAVTIINRSGSDQTITSNLSNNFYHSGGSATPVSSVTLAGRGMATIWFAAGDTAYVSGAGVS